jgi:hypothetical protein
MSVGGEAVPERGKGGDDDSWIDVNPYWAKKMKKIHAIDSAAINGW